MEDPTQPPESLIPDFKYERVLNQDQAGRRIILHGEIQSKPAILILERGPFPSSPAYLSNLPRTLSQLQNLGANDIYFWYLASSHSRASGSNGGSHEGESQDLKINLIYPCTAQHIKKYSSQGVRLVHETAAIYMEKIRPYMESKRSEGRLNWVYNIIEGQTEVEDVIFRTPLGESTDEEGFLLLPDLNWDRKTMSTMHLMCLVERRDIWSLRDLRKKHVKWLRDMREHLLDSAVKCYGEKGLERDQLKLYVHYQPTYYHFHIHIVHVALEAGVTQATGKAIGLESIIETLEHMAGDEESGMEALEMCYTIGEASELWTEIFQPLKTENGTSSR
ncbi:HIT-like domain-containing protein [Amylocarpus encephaloides]|uniref:HIT-like domain-containing protein n=1 Tax=Amylocarpus encephaloides TaxID=45428 RepID=A0A9P7YQ95_9HELO|nr:HIT-like domain-containing protein [Amylocarpus encephaloides]